MGASYYCLGSYCVPFRCELVMLGDIRIGRSSRFRWSFYDSNITDVKNPKSLRYR